MPTRRPMPTPLVLNALAALCLFLAHVSAAPAQGIGRASASAEERGKGLDGQAAPHMGRRLRGEDASAQAAQDAMRQWALTRAFRREAQSEAVECREHRGEEQSSRKGQGQGHWEDLGQREGQDQGHGQGQREGQIHKEGQRQGQGQGQGQGLEQGHVSAVLALSRQAGPSSGGASWHVGPARPKPEFSVQRVQQIVDMLSARHSRRRLLPNASYPRTQAATASSKAATSGAGTSGSGSGGPSTTAAMQAFARVRQIAEANGILYKGGQIMSQPINVYLIFYGNWTRASCGVRVIGNMIASISDPQLAKKPGLTLPNWWKVVMRYGQSDGRNVSSQVRLAGSIVDRYSKGPRLAHGQDVNSTWDVIRTALDAKRFPMDPNGVYLVLSSADVKVGPAGGGFCSSYCGWHSAKWYKNMTVLYGFAGDGSSQCPGTTCAMKLGKAWNSPTPNRCPGADGMASTVLHEVAEAATNPTFKGWSTLHGTETADLCQRQYLIGAKWSLPSKDFLYNLDGRLGYRFLVQSMFDPLSGKCVQT